MYQNNFQSKSNPQSANRQIQGQLRNKSPNHQSTSKIYQNSDQKKNNFQGSPSQKNQQYEDSFLDDEFIRLMLEVENFYQNMNKHERIRIEQWTKKLCQVTSNTIWKKNRNKYAKQLLDNVKNGKLQPPFLKQPQEGPLQKFNKFEIMPVRVAERENNWQSIRSKSKDKQYQQYDSNSKNSVQQIMYSTQQNNFFSSSGKKMQSVNQSPQSYQQKQISYKYNNNINNNDNQEKQKQFSSSFQNFRQVNQQLKFSGLEQNYNQDSNDNYNDQFKIQDQDQQSQLNYMQQSQQQQDEQEYDQYQETQYKMQNEYQNKQFQQFQQQQQPKKYYYQNQQESSEFQQEQQELPVKMVKSDVYHLSQILQSPQQFSQVQNNQINSNNQKFQNDKTIIEYRTELQLAKITEKSLQNELSA